MQFYYILLMMGDPEKGGSAWPNMLFIGAIFFIMYFFMIRPQSKKAKEQRTFISSIQKGDKVVTIGGVHGKVLKVNEDGTVLVEVDANTKLKIEKSSLSVEFSKKAQIK